jgi:hypothetical protein
MNKKMFWGGVFSIIIFGALGKDYWWCYIFAGLGLISFIGSFFK